MPNGIDLEGLPIIDPRSEATWKKKEINMQKCSFKKEERKGFNAYEAKKVMQDRNYFGCMMVECGDADAMISGLAKNYPDTIRPAIAYHRYRRRRKENCRHVSDADQKRALISCRYHREF